MRKNVMKTKYCVTQNGLMCASYMVLKFKSAQLKMAVIRQGICLQFIIKLLVVLFKNIFIFMFFFNWWILV